MIKFRKYIKRLLSPLLIIIAKQYLKKERTYSYKGIHIKVKPGVFHPGLFFSTKILLAFLSGYNLSGKRVLELGAGSGLISVYAAIKGALVTAVDISRTAIECISVNSKRNNVHIEIIQSDLFDGLNGQLFDLIIINPPYFPYNPNTESEYAWFCGEDFQYFRKLFCQLKSIRDNGTEIIMILSEDCAVSYIREIANENGIDLKLNSTVNNWFEENHIFSFSFKS